MPMNETPSYVSRAMARGRPGLMAIAVATLAGVASMGAVLARIVDPAPRSSAPAVTLPAQDETCSQAEFECAWDPAHEAPPPPSAPSS